MKESVFAKLQDEAMFYRYLRQVLKAGLRQYIYSIILLSSLRVVLIVSVWAIVLVVFWQDINGIYKIFIIVGIILYSTTEVIEFKNRSRQAVQAIKEAEKGEREAADFLMAALRTYEIDRESLLTDESGEDHD